MTGAIGGVGGVGGAAMSMPSMGGVSAAAPASPSAVSAGQTATAPTVSDSAAQMFEVQEVVTLGNSASPQMFGAKGVTGANAYSAVQAMDGASLNINYIAQQTGLSTDFVNGFVMGVGMAEQAWADKLTDALILMLLLEKMNKQ